MRALPVAAAAAAAAALALAAVVLWPHDSAPAASAAGRSSASASAGAPSSPAPGPTVPPLTGQDGATLSAELASGQAGQVRRAVLVPAGQPLPAELPAQLASLGTLTFDPASFTADPDSAGTATVSATSTPAGRPAAHWTVRLVHDDAAGWLVVTAEPQQ